MLSTAIEPLIKGYYEENRENGFDPKWELSGPRLTVQGGIGTHGEAERLLSDFEMDSTGWGSPFLMVPEATTVDEPTMKVLERAKEDDLYLSGVSPLGVPFNNVKNTGSERWHRDRIEKEKPGSPCPKGFLESNTEFTENPICTASTQYQLLKINQINESEAPDHEKERSINKVLDKACLCDHLGNGALISLGILKEHRAPQAICPGPNIAWFNRKYSLKEMTDHIYGRTNLITENRPHMFAKEMIMYVDYLEELIEQSEDPSKDLRSLTRFKNNLEKGMAYCEEIALSDSFESENLNSITSTVAEQRARLALIFEKLEEKILVAQ